MTQTTPPTHIEAHIQGDTSGQVAIGNHIIQIGSVHGGLVNVIPPGQQIAPRPRPTPVLLRPRRWRGLLDRKTEINVATSACQSGLPVDLYGEAGLGKTSLLRHLAHHLPTTLFPDGIIYLPARNVPLSDLLQSLFEALYESDVSFKPTEAQIRHGLQNIRALIILDDVDLARDQVNALLDAAPVCVFLLASTGRKLWGEGQIIALRGLPLKDALVLMERELDRPLTSEEQPAARALCAALEGHPLRLIQAAALAREQNCSLLDVVQRTRAASPGRALTAQVLASLSGPERRVLLALAALDNAPLHRDHLSALTKIANLTPVLESLQRRGLIQAHGPRYTLTGALAQDLQAALDQSPWARRALDYFGDWATRHRSNPKLLLEESAAILQTLQWAVEAQQWTGVLRLGRAVEGALALGKRWGAWGQVLQWILQAARALEDQASEAWALHQQGSRSLCLEEATLARSALVQALRLRESMGERAGAAVTKHNLSILLGPPLPPRKQPPQPPSPPPAPRLQAILTALKTSLLISVFILIVVLGSALFLFSPNPPPDPTATVTIAITPTSTAIPPTQLPTWPPPTIPPPTLAPTPSNTPTHTPTSTSTSTPTPWPCGDPPEHWELYTVQSKDGLYPLARTRLVSPTERKVANLVDDIVCYNRLLDLQLQPGQKIYLPPLPTPTPSSTPTATPTNTPTATNTPIATDTPIPTHKSTLTPISTPVVLYDFVKEANSAQWDSSSGLLPFPGEEDDERGFALWRKNATLEDGSRPLHAVLETHPQWTSYGYIRGKYTDTKPIVIEKGDLFIAKVGFLQGAKAGDVTFYVEFSTVCFYAEEFPPGVSSLDDSYDGQVLTQAIPLNKFAGQQGCFRLGVFAGETAAQDWAVWVEARLERP